MSKTLIAGEVQFRSEVMSIRRAGFSSRPPVPCVPSAEICYVTCLCPNWVRTDPGEGDGCGTGGPCSSSPAQHRGRTLGYINPSLFLLTKHRVSAVVEIPAAPPGRSPGCWGSPGHHRHGCGRGGHQRGGAVPPTAVRPAAGPTGPAGRCRSGAAAAVGTGTELPPPPPVGLSRAAGPGAGHGWGG